MSGPHWTTGRGETIAITDMTDAHLANCIAFLERRVASLSTARDDAMRASCFMSGEMSGDVMDYVVEDYEDELVVTRQHLSLMQCERDRRRRDVIG